MKVFRIGFRAKDDDGSFVTLFESDCDAVCNGDYEFRIMIDDDVIESIPLKINLLDGVNK